MLLRFLSLLLAASVFSLACDDDEPEPSTVPTDEVGVVSPTPLAETAQPAAGVTPAPGPGWDESAVWADFYDGEVFTCLENLPGGDLKACILEVAAEAGATQAAIDFIEANEAALVSFQELGVIDFGTVAWPAFNMGREEPVVLNGDFGVLYYGTLVPEDWHTADPSYEAIEVDAAGLGPYPWSEYSALVEATTDSGGQRLVFETVIQECRACQPVGFLVVEVRFDQSGSPTGSDVLPLRCEPEAGVFQDVIVGEGPCN
jgi:hypothetical protein